MGNLIAVLSLFVRGYSLGRATIRTVLIGRARITVAMKRLIFSHNFQIAGLTAASGKEGMSSTDRGHYR